jgi:hypothetical protein
MVDAAGSPTPAKSSFASVRRTCVISPRWHPRAPPGQAPALCAFYTWVGNMGPVKSDVNFLLRLDGNTVTCPVRSTVISIGRLGDAPGM